MQHCNLAGSCAGNLWPALQVGSWRATEACDAQRCAAIRALVAEAYRRYVPLIGKPPGPMLDDYEARVRDNLVFVTDTDGALATVLVLIAKDDHVLLDNIAVAPPLQGRGLGAKLVRFAEQEAQRHGFTGIRLYTHAVMHENVRLYQRLGFVITHRTREDGYDRIYMSKLV